MLTYFNNVVKSKSFSDEMINYITGNQLFKINVNQKNNKIFGEKFNTNKLLDELKKAEGKKYMQELLQTNDFSYQIRQAIHTVSLRNLSTNENFNSVVEKTLKK